MFCEFLRRGKYGLECVLHEVECVILIHKNVHGVACLLIRSCSESLELMSCRSVRIIPAHPK